MPISKNQEIMGKKIKGISDNVETNRRAIEEPGELILVSMKVPDNHWETLKRIAKKEGVNVSILIRQAIKDIIEGS
jgi:predicted DNA-binding ribbon-helix-helix protein